jgi:hypothetical protein
MSSSFSKSCAALLVMMTGACTITTTDSKNSGAGGGTTAAGSGGGGSGSAGTTASTTAATTGTAGSSGAGGSDGGTTTPDGSGGGGGGGSDAAVPNDPCNGGTETTPNEDRNTATPYPLGASAHACLQSITDVDFYEFTVPTTPAQGGYVKVQLTDVGQEGSLEVHAFAAHDNGEFDSNYNPTDGGSVFLYFAAKAGATFRLKVNRFGGVAMPTAYTLMATYNPVNDANEPNDDNAHATPIMVGKTVNGFFFAGLEDSTDPAAAAWEDRFKVTLPAGDVTIALTSIASDISGMVKLYSPLGSAIDSMYDPANGSSVILKTTVTSGDAGDCFIVVEPFSGSTTHGNGSTVPVYWSTPYSLLVTTP